MAIDISNLTFSYTGSEAQSVLSIPAWHVEEGEHVFLYGPSGSGKSTLLNILAGILKPLSGTVELLGSPFSALSARKRDEFRARHIGVVFQQFNLVPYLSVLDNILLAAHFGSRKTPEGRRSSADVQARAEALLARLSLDKSLLHQRADALSVGQQQRVAIVRALINDPELVIADEPTSALDSDARDQFIDLLLECVGDGKRALIFVSHDRSLASHFSTSVDLQTLNQKAHVHAA
ncbi:ABC transporter ATP-binding protein [Allohahella marinimesophila]|uniref:ABC transporter ATP-binding protein n=1 Tax=Allohahella marinimesophila TaxID=1054972 RepID=A0ABP7NSS4_9GAMM